MNFTADARHKRQQNLNFIDVFAIDLQRGCWKIFEAADCNTKQSEGIFPIKKGPPTFQCNETPPIPQIIPIQIYSILTLIRTLSWCMQRSIQYPLLWGDKTVAPTQRKSSCSFDTTHLHPGYTAQPLQGWTCSG